MTEEDFANTLKNGITLSEIENALNSYTTNLQNSTYTKGINTPVRQSVCETLGTRYLVMKKEIIVTKSLELLLALSRDKALSNTTAFDKKILDLLLQLAQKDFKERKVNLLSLKCLSNIIYQTKDSNNLCSNRIFLNTIVTQLFEQENCTHDEKVMLIRTLYLCTAFSSVGRKHLVEELNLRQLLLNFSKVCLDIDSNDTQNTISLNSTTLLNEVLKLLFNVFMDVQHAKIITQQTENEMNELLKICYKVFTVSFENDKLQQDIYLNASSAAYCIPQLHFDVDIFLPLNKDSENEKSRDISTVEKLFDILEMYLKLDKSDQTMIIPIVAFFSLLSRLNSGVRKYLKSLILPPRKNFKLRPEEGDKTQHKLIKMLTSVNTKIKVSVAELLFVLCKEKSEKFVKHTGYGNAAGLLQSRGLLGMNVQSTNTCYSSDSEDSDTEEYKTVEHKIDPVTGHIPMPRANPMENMSEEQKEYLAVQLANQICKLDSNSAIQPMVVDEEGNLVTMRERVHKMKINDESHD